MKVMKNFYYDISLKGFQCYIMPLDVELNIFINSGKQKRLSGRKRKRGLECQENKVLST